MIALAFGLLALRGVTANTPVGPDATRHVMNGAFLYDLVRTGKLSAPLEFGVYYYSRLPSLSLPYHPPLFPAFEALSFFGFGVQALTPRVLVALATAVSAYLYYRLVVRTYGSAALAAASTIGFFMLRGSQYLARDVMLEFPMLVFVLGAMHCLVGLDRTSPLRRGLAFGFLAGAAMWTKQSAVFIGLVPFLYGGISAQWSILRARALWVSTALLAMAAVGLLLVSSPPGRIAPPQVVGLDGFVSSLDSVLPSIRAGSGPIWDHWPLSRSLYFFSGSCSQSEGNRVRSVPVMRSTSRGAWPPSCRSCWPRTTPVGTSSSCIPASWCWRAPGCCGLGGGSCRDRGHPWPWLSRSSRGPSCSWRRPSHWRRTSRARPRRLARSSRRDLRRVLYCGGKTNGHFIFEVRQLDPNLRTIVIRCDKLPQSCFTARRDSSGSRIDMVSITWSSSRARTRVLGMASRRSSCLRCSWRGISRWPFLGLVEDFVYIGSRILPRIR